MSKRRRMIRCFLANARFATGRDGQCMSGRAWVARRRKARNNCAICCKCRERPLPGAPHVQRHCTAPTPQFLDLVTPLVTPRPPCPPLRHHRGRRKAPLPSPRPPSSPRRVAVIRSDGPRRRCRRPVPDPRRYRGGGRVGGPAKRSGHEAEEE